MAGRLQDMRRRFRTVGAEWVASNPCQRNNSTDWVKIVNQGILCPGLEFGSCGNQIGPDKAMKMVAAGKS